MMIRKKGESMEEKEKAGEAAAGGDRTEHNARTRKTDAWLELPDH